MGACHSTGKNQISTEEFDAGSPTPTLNDMWSDTKAVATLKSPRKQSRQQLKQKVAHALKDAKHLGQDVIRKLRRELGGDLHHHAETCIPGIYSENGLHDIITDLFHSNVISEADLLIKTSKSNKAFKEAQGKPRTVENYRPVWEAVKKAIGDDSVQFPETLTPETLQRLVAHNPFVTMGLSFENNQICWNASTRSKNPITAAVMSALNFQTACMYFSPDLMPTALELEGEGKYTPDHPEFDTKLRAFITPLLYFFEMVHATLHVWTYVMLDAAEFATFATDMAGFVHQYEPNIFLKYQEVALLLFKKKGGVLTGGYWKNVNYDNCMAAAKKMFEHMSAQRNSRDWYENVFCAGCPQLIDNDSALPLAKPYVHMFEQLSAKTMKKLRQEVEDQYFVRLQDINDKLVEHLNLADGKENDETFFGLSNFSQWIECQGMAGVLHGSTLGLTRLIFTKYNVADGDWNTTTIGDNFLTAGVAVGTLLGLEEQHAVNETQPLKRTAFYKMMETFESETQRLQKEFWDSLPEEEKTEYRWIFSVWGPNMLDSTQLTITTYV